MTEPNSSFHILVVDDTPRNLQLLMSILSREKYKIHAAQDGIQALKKAQAIIPDLILLDVMMPEIDGFEACKQLKSSPETEDIPIIFLTALTETKDIVKGFELGAVDYVTKPFNSTELLARVHTHLELRAKGKKLEESYQTIKKQQEVIQEEMNQARKTQQSLLPQQLPDIPNTRTAVKFIPMEEIGGDFYDVFELEKDVFGLMVADVTGHGVSAALLSFMFSSMFSNARLLGTSPELTLRLTNAYVENKVEAGKFATMFYAVYNASTQQVTYTSASHPCGFVIRPSTEKIIKLDTNGMLMGMFSPNEVNYKEKTIQLYPKDKLLLYTDAITEVQNKQGKMLGRLRFESFLLKNKNSHIADLLEQIYEFGNEFSEGNGFGDDFTVLGLEVM